MFVPDADTIASRLQARLPTERIVNEGAVGIAISEEYILLTRADIKSGDMIIFMDGAEEHVPYCTSPLAVLQVLCSTLTDAYPPQNIAKWQRIGSAASAYAYTHGATFVHFVQAWRPPVLANFPGIHLYSPPADFVDEGHLNADGDAIVAREIYSAITLI